MNLVTNVIFMKQKTRRNGVAKAVWPHDVQPA
jgi:hypothetical protein